MSTLPLQSAIDSNSSSSRDDDLTVVQRMQVLIVDDHRLFADALKPLLEGHGISVVGVATTGRDALALVREKLPDLVLLDLGLPDADGVEVGVNILAERPATKVIAIDGMNSPQAIRDVMQAGFHGYLTKDIAGAQLIHSIHAALEGQVTIPHRLASAAAGVRSPSERRVELLAARLTPREAEILTLLVEGAPTREIANRLGLSANTIRTHIQSMLAKLGVHSRLEAATFAVRTGLVRLPREKRYA